MAIVIISLLVLVPLALLSWDLARSKRRDSSAHAAGFTPTTVSGTTKKMRPNAS